MPAYAVTMFLGAFLLFQVQPLIGKFVLPWFGGGPGVWTTCMLFFQILLLVGYAYAHWTTQKLKPRMQLWLHLALMAVAIVSLPIIPGARWKPAGNSSPVLGIVTLLAGCVGLPYFVLSTTAPLVQHWFQARFPGRPAYRLYALSNLGSLLGLVSYPFLFEPRFTRRTQSLLWEGGLVLYVVACGWCAWQQGRGSKPTKTKRSQREPIEMGDEVNAPGLVRKLLWLLLPATASALLLAVTNKLCQDVAVIPFLWVAPLSIYLLSFIICFESDRWYRRVPFTLALVVSMVAVCWALTSGASWPFWKQLTVYGSGLFVWCMVCHGEVYRLRPEPKRLTAYYLWIAGGGALGGLFVSAAAPLLFTNYYELHWGLFVCGLLLALICVGEGSRVLPVAPSPTRWGVLACSLPLLGFAGLDWGLTRLARENKMFTGAHVTALRCMMWVFVGLLMLWLVVRTRRNPLRYSRALACCWLVLGLVLLGAVLWSQSQAPNPERIATSRNFYGVLTLYEHRLNEPKNRHLLLQHGRITHGLQFEDPAQATWATTYYGGESGVGLGLDSLSISNRSIGLVGLGAGTLASYASLGDQLKIYEINPQVIELAQTRFSYLKNCAGTVEIVPGDARLSLEREPPQDFDFLALDAFSGDAIPVHLLTREAFELYNRHLKPGGIIAVHISNHFLDLAPVVLGLAQEFNYRIAVVDYDETPEDWWLYSSTWVLLSRDPMVLDSPEICAAALPAKTPAKTLLWTDDFTSLFQILKKE